MTKKLNNHQTFFFHLFFVIMNNGFPTLLIFLKKHHLEIFPNSTFLFSILTSLFCFYQALTSSVACVAFNAFLN